MTNAYKISFQEHGDTRGMLVALEYGKECPFEIKRVYYVYNTKDDVRRGYHAHSDLEQILICVNGSCTIHVETKEGVEEVVLNTPTEGLFIGCNVWREMYDFSENAVLLVLASKLYDEDDYIRDYQKFMSIIKD